MMKNERKRSHGSVEIIANAGFKLAREAGEAARGYNGEFSNGMWGSTEAIAGVVDVFSFRNDGLRIASCVREVLFVGVLAGTEEKSFHPKNTKSFGLY